MTTPAYAAEAEQLARDFARSYPTPAVLRAVALCETGELDWVAVAALFARSFAVARADVEGR